MASKIKLSNANGKIVTIENNDSNMSDVTLNGASITKKVDTLANMRAMNELPETVWCSGYHTKGDGAFGSHFYILKGLKTTETDNSGTIIIVSVGGSDYAYELQYSESVNVKWFGAAGDGITDDTTAIQNTINIINGFAWEGTISATKISDRNNYRGVVFFPSGKYRITDQLLLNPGVTLLGQDRPSGFFQDFDADINDSSIFCDFDDLAKFALDTAPYEADGLRHPSLLKTFSTGFNSTSTTTLEGIHIKNMSIVSNKLKNAIYGGIRFAASPGFSMENCNVVGFMTGIMISACWGNKLRDNYILSKGIGITCPNLSNNTASYSNYIIEWRGNEALTILNAPYIEDEHAVTNPASSRFYTTGIYLAETSIFSSYSDTIEHFDRVARASDSSQLKMQSSWIENIQQVIFEGSASQIISSNCHFWAPSTTVFAMRSDGLYKLIDPSGNYGLLYDSSITTGAQVELYGRLPELKDNYERRTTQFSKSGQRQIYAAEYEKQSVKELYVNTATGLDTASGFLEVTPMKSLEEAMNRFDSVGNYVIYLERGQTFSMPAFTTLPAGSTLEIRPNGIGAKPIINWHTADRISSMSLHNGTVLNINDVTINTVQASTFISESRFLFSVFGTAVLNLTNVVFNIGGSQGLFGNKVLSRGEFLIYMSGCSINPSLDLSAGSLSRSQGTNSAKVFVTLFASGTTKNASIGTWGATTVVNHSDIV